MDDICPSCATALPAEARFCSGCGQARPASGSGPAEGRKVVSVVFCDLVGSTEISGRLEPETLRQVTLRYFDLMKRQIEAHGGTVEKFIGDAVMAVFGVPVMREDDARRAATAALDMLDALDGLNAELAVTPGVRLDVRIGVNTGEVVATSDAAARQALVSGEVVNVAARLEQNAGAGQILIGPTTLRALGPAAVVEDAGPLRLKGKADPVPGYRLLGVRGDAPELLRRFDTPFIGRHAELAELDQVLGRVAAGRGCHLVTLYGEAGIGKTRLARTWLDRLRTPDVAHGAGRCRPYGETGSLTPLADALRSLLERANAADRPTPGEDAERADEAEALAALGEGLLRDGTPSPSLDDTCAALARLLTSLARRRPLVLVIDDCHWADVLLLETLERLVDVVDPAAVLVVCAGRPDLLDKRTGWGSGRFNSVALMLQGLSDEEAVRLAAGLVEVGAHGDGVHGDGGTAATAGVLERAEGNPLHLEQLLAVLGDGPPGELPPTVNALLGARIDALAPEERGALDLAAVIGREFGLAQLTELAGPADDTRTVRLAVRQLTRRRLVEPVRHRTGDDPVHRFSSGLVQEVAYQAMAKRVRAGHHERAADLLAAQGAGAATVGRHLERAHRYRVDLALLDAHTDTLRRRAGELLADAGADALARADLARAENLLTRAVALCDPPEPPWPAAARRLAEARLARGALDEARHLLRQVLTTADPLTAAHARLTLACAGDDSGQPEQTGQPGETEQFGRPGETEPTGQPAQAGRAERAEQMGRPGRAEQPEEAGQVEQIGRLGQVGWHGVCEDPAVVAEAVLPVFAAAGDSLGTARARLRIAQREQAYGRHGAADRLLTEALRDAVQADAEPERAAALGAVGVSLWLGPEPVPDAVARCRALLAEHGERRRAVRLTLNCPLAVLLALQRRWDEARTCLADAERLARELGYAEADIFLPVFSATVAATAGEPDRAERLLLRAEDACRAAGAPGLPAPIARELARVLLARGDWRGALARTEPDDAGLPPSEAADRNGLRARIAALRGAAAEAALLADRAVHQAAGTDSPVLRAVALLDRARTSVALGRPAEAVADATEAGRLFAAKGHLPGADEAAALAGTAAEPRTTCERSE